MITLGCDIGSLFSKAVVLDDDRPAASRIVETTGNIAGEIDGLLDAVIAEAGLDRGSIDCLVGTGNGADMIGGADFVEDDVVCVGQAVGYYMPGVEMAIDIGGQSITSMVLDEHGGIVNFMRNDKCASGSGRFLEVMSAKLQLDVPSIDRVAARAADPVLISNQCGVFAESEVITHVNDGRDTADIVAGICASVANIVVAQGRKFGTGRTFTLTGGVARVGAVVEVIGQKLGGQYRPFPHDPGLAAALGAALMGGAE